MIQNQFKTSFDIIRNGWTTVTIDGNTYDQTAETTVGTFMGHLQQATAEYAQYNALSISKGFRVWCPLDTAVAEGDVIKTGDVQYAVRARKVLRQGENNHAELAVELIGKDGVQV